MRVFAVICEYNPFHGGHARQIELMREKGADMIVAVMSGNFVERGEPACFDKFRRAEAALKGGADLVVEMPALLSTLSAGEFASAGVGVVRSLGIVDALCFGVEEDVGTKELIRSRDIYKNIHGESKKMASLLREGAAYPEAAERLFREYSKDPVLTKKMRCPNNILAAEYLRALEASDIEALPIPRDKRFLSSSRIRSSLREDGIIRPDDLSGILNIRLLDAKYSERTGALSRFLDVSEEMEGRLLRDADTFMSFSERAALLKTRQYTLSRVRRALLHIVLLVTKAEFEERRAAGYATYIRVLGFSKRAVEKGLMKNLKSNASLPIVVKPADHKDLIANDVYRDEIYYSLSHAPGEYTRSPVGPL